MRQYFGSSYGERSRMGGFRVYLALFLFVVCDLPFPVPVFAQEGGAGTGDTRFISLEGIHRFQVGDDPAWSNPSFDDSAWSVARVPGIWQQQGIGDVCDIGWYRIRFNFPSELSEREQMLSLGYAGNATQVYLNGNPLGSIGGFDPVYLPPNLTLHLYSLPSEFLLAGQENLLAVRVMNQVGVGGLVEGPIGIGTSGPLYALYYRGVQQRSMVVILVFLAVAVLLIAQLILIARSIAQPWQKWSAGFLATVLCSYAIPVSFMMQNEWRGASLSFVWILGVAAPALFNGMVIRFCGVYPRGLLLMNVCLTVAMMVAVFLFGESLAWYEPLSDVTGLYMGYFCIVSFVFCARALKNRLPAAVPVLAATTVLFGGAIVDALSATWAFYAYSASPLIAWEVALFLVLPFLLYTAFRQYADDRQHLLVLNRQILTERESERKRLAQDLHDGLGQSLQALKMKLQLDKRDRKHVDSPGVAASSSSIEQVSQCIRQLRMLAREMHPAISKELTTRQTIDNYAQELAREFSIQIDVEMNSDLETEVWSDEVAAHCFLIFKEALGNAVRHGGANRIRFRLESAGSGVRLEINDNGKGFDVSEALKQQRGLGLRSIRDRAEFLGGHCRVESSPETGTSVIVHLHLGYQV